MAKQVKQELDLESTPTMESESPAECHEEPVAPAVPAAPAMPAAPAASTAPKKPAEPIEPKGTLVVDLTPKPVPVEAKSFSHSLSSQKKVTTDTGNDTQKGITRKGLGGKALGATSIEPMAAKKPVEAVRARGRDDA